MKKSRNILMLLLVSVGALFLSDTSFAIDSNLQTTVGQYLNALKDGDVQSIMRILTEEQYQRREKLLKNPRYSRFLKKYYKDCEFRIEDIRPLSENRVEVDIEIYSGEQMSSATTLTFKIHNEVWKLVHDKKRTY